jgi:hypothetical protein
LKTRLRISTSRARQAALWTLSRQPYFALAIVFAAAWFLLRRRRRVVWHFYGRDSAD